VKNKKATYFLLPIAAIIWGLIIYKIFVPETVEENNFSMPAIAKSKESTKMRIDTFDLQLNYQDPFLKNVKNAAVSNPNNQAGKEQEQKTKAKTEEKPVVFPEIIYEGIVKHISRGKALVIVNINGKSQFLQTGDSFENIKLIEVHNDSIVVKYEKQNKTILKK
jgi:type II secretory pathway component PulC